jgi:hypothetical protein
MATEFMAIYQLVSDNCPHLWNDHPIYKRQKKLIEGRNCGGICHVTGFHMMKHLSWTVGQHWTLTQTRRKQRIRQCTLK